MTAKPTIAFWFCASMQTLFPNPFNLVLLDRRGCFPLAPTRFAQISLASSLCHSDAGSRFSDRTYAET